MNCNGIQNNIDVSGYLVKCPKALQWFEDGRLHKVSTDDRQAGRFELLLDLLCECRTNPMSPLTHKRHQPVSLLLFTMRTDKN